MLLGASRYTSFETVLSFFGCQTSLKYFRFGYQIYLFKCNHSGNNSILLTTDHLFQYLKTIILTQNQKKHQYITKMGDNYVRNAASVPSRNREPEMETDYRIMKSLKRAKSGVEHNNKITFITFFLELLVIIIVVVSWVMLRNT